MLRNQLRAGAVLSLAVLGLAGVASAQPPLVNQLFIPGNGVDQSTGVPNGANTNRLGGFISDLYYDKTSNSYFGIVDRGPGGGVFNYDTRIQKFTLDVDPNTGAISNFVNTATILFKNADGSAPFNGAKPNPADTLANSFDPEGFVILPSGNYLLADEYGPSVYEFAPTAVGPQTEARFVRAFGVPGNLVPRDNDGNVNYSLARRVVNEPPAVDVPNGVVKGRQDNRGYEGLTLSADGTKAFAFLQDPLQEEGNPTGVSLPNGDGRRSRNTRIVRYDVATGLPDAQYIYQLEAIADINPRVPSLVFSGTAQGRNIGVNSAITLSDGRILVLERDNRGIGADDPTGKNPIGTKRIYAIDLTGATDVSAITLAGTNTLTGKDALNQPVIVTPVQKSLYLDIYGALSAAGFTTPEKIEGMVFGPDLLDGHHSFLVGTDNDFSVTQLVDTNVQFDVYVNPGGDPKVLYSSLDDPAHTFAVAGDGIDLGPLPAGYELLPTRIMSFNVVPEPGTCALLGIGAITLGMRRSRKRDVI